MPEEPSPLTPLQYLKGVGPKRGEQMAGKGFVTWWDLLCHLPLRLEDRSSIIPIVDLEPGMTAAVAGKTLAIQGRRTRRRNLFVIEALISDATGSINVVWFNQRHILDHIHPGDEVVMFGKVDQSPHFHLSNPVWEKMAEKGKRTGRTVPIYPAVAKIKSPTLQTLISRALHALEANFTDPLPVQVLEKLKLTSLLESLNLVHGNGSIEDYAKGRQRLAFDEILAFMLKMRSFKVQRKSSEKGVALAITDSIRRQAQKILPFQLTRAQYRVTKEIADDLSSGIPMHRLLQGDVGSGKTIVACLAALITMANTYQVAFMAPTSILADQHAVTLDSLLRRSPYTTALLTGATTQKEKKTVLEGLADGSINFLVGTHALLEDPVVFKKLGLIIVDEQHRFGVKQRQRLKAKGVLPHYLVMTATPIPRTLAMTTYGDLDISTLDEMPPGRQPVSTHLRDEGARGNIYTFIEERCSEGDQAYIIYPLIEESEALALRSLEEHAEALIRRFKPLTVAVLHGRMSPKEKRSIMTSFANGKITILLSTTVIEVGIDVPNATTMLIENAERYGLSQLHQLRGRIGRGSKPSYCIILKGDRVSGLALERLEAFASTTDGFALAEKDLALRGPGDLTGIRQWGLPGFKVFNLTRDAALVRKAEKAIHLLPASLKKSEIENLARYLGALWHKSEEIVA